MKKILAFLKRHAAAISAGLGAFFALLLAVLLGRRRMPATPPLEPPELKEKEARASEDLGAARAREEAARAEAIRLEVERDAVTARHRKQIEDIQGAENWAALERHRESGNQRTPRTLPAPPPVSTTPIPPSRTPRERP